MSHIGLMVDTDDHSGGGGKKITKFESGRVYTPSFWEGHAT